ncbi:signal peptidase II [Nocardioides aequoreus]|uniref:signal peptidase II n=1 Tax=Nocardioides aequoreus TaxID=397278 RepID=UPI000AB6C2E7|nr:signal peptidase II [Nocardioides aequoreus]
MSGDETPGRRRTTLALAFAAVGLTVDQVTKVLAVRELTDRDPVEVVGTLLQLVLVYNPGAAWGAGSSITPVITAIAIVATVVVLWQITKVRHVGWAVALGLLLAGVAGNLTDRMLRDPGPFRGHVVDFLALPNFPVFNVADMCINVAGVLLVVLLFRGIGVDGTRESREQEVSPR